MDAEPVRTDAVPAAVLRRPPFGSNPLVGARGSDTQRRILDAALEVFAEVGFADTRVELITERAGCSRPAFYQYFAGKHDVFWALASRLGEEMVTLAAGLGPVTPDDAGLAHLTGWVGRFLTLHEAWAPVFASFLAASRDHRPEARGRGGAGPPPRRGRGGAPAPRRPDPPTAARRRGRGAAGPRLPRHPGRRPGGGGRPQPRHLLPLLRQQGRLLPGPGRGGGGPADRDARRAPPRRAARRAAGLAADVAGRLRGRRWGHQRLAGDAGQHGAAGLLAGGGGVGT